MAGIPETQPCNGMCVYYGEFSGIATFLTIDLDMDGFYTMVACMIGAGRVPEAPPGGALRIDVNGTTREQTVTASRSDLDVAAAIGGMKTANQTLAAYRVGPLLALRLVEGRPPAQLLDALANCMGLTLRE